MEHSPGLHALGYSTSRYEMNGNRGVRLCSAEAVAEGKRGKTPAERVWLLQGTVAPLLNCTSRTSLIKS
jgi:hypothetical protein